MYDIKTTAFLYINYDLFVYVKVPRAILADLEPGTIDSVKAGSMGRLFRYQSLNMLVKYSFVQKLMYQS